MLLTFQLISTAGVAALWLLTFATAWEYVDGVTFPSVYVEVTVLAAAAAGLVSIVCVTGMLVKMWKQ